MKIYPPLRKASSGSYFAPPSPSEFNKVHAFKVKPVIPSFPAIVATTSVESCAETPALRNNYFPENKFNLETIFSHSRRKYLTFKKALSSKGLTTPTHPLEHISVTFDHEYHEESNISSIFSFETECPPDSKFTSTSNLSF